MKMAIFGKFGDRSQEQLAISYARAFERLGHSVFCIPASNCTRGIKRTADQVVDSGAEVALVISGSYHVAPKRIRAWRAQNIKVASILEGNPMSILSSARFRSQALETWRSLERLFVHDRFASGQLRQLGIRSAFIAYARDVEFHDRRFLSTSVTMTSQIIFVGNPDSERIRYLRAIADLGLSLWGRWREVGISSDDPLSACVKGGELYGLDRTRRVSAAVLSINILRGGEKTAHNRRTFESPACGVCTVSERSNGVLELMEDGEEVITFRSPEELRAKVKELLRDSKLRERVAERGWERVKGETYDARARQILGELG